MSIIYEPQGMALEYAELAANLYRGCSHGCAFCYAPSVLRKSGTTLEAFRNEVKPRPNIIRGFACDCRKLAAAGNAKRVLLSFTTDPYQPAEREHRITRQALQILNEHNTPWQVCTKNGLQAMEDDIDLFTQGAEGWLGQTIVFTRDADRQIWEPGASTIGDRFKALEMAHAAGITTWVSIEPVIDPAQALELIERAWPLVDMWKIGKINHLHLLDPEFRAQVEGIDWQGFVNELTPVLRRRPGTEYLIKDSLAEYCPPELPRNALRSEQTQQATRVRECARRWPRNSTLF
ncbi:MAG: hypothetical protein WCP21_06770 [Armatimonadota bacterium]